MKVKIKCHTCDGEGKITEEAYPGPGTVDVRCPECKGKLYILMDIWVEEMNSQETMGKIT